MPGIKITNTAGIAAAGESVILHAAAVHAVHALMQLAASRERCQAPKNIPTACGRHGPSPHRAPTPYTPLQLPAWLPARPPPRPGRAGSGAPGHRVIPDPDPAPWILPRGSAPRQHCCRWARAEGIAWELDAKGAALPCPATSSSLACTCCGGARSWVHGRLHPGTTPRPGAPCPGPCPYPEKATARRAQLTRH